MAGNTLKPEDVHICALLYGDHFDLHMRLLNSFKEAVPKETPVTIWCNQVGTITAELLGAMDRPNWHIIMGEGNTPKYKAMASMFKPLKAPGSWPRWVVHFDDDSYITDPDWFKTMAEYIARNPKAVYIGQPWQVKHLPGQMEFIKRSKWYKGRQEQVVKGAPGVTFAQGAYWWLRVDVLKQLDWPDPRLVRNGGDTLLAVALHQNGYKLHNCSFGVKVNDAKRRGLSEAPAGCKDPKFRR